MKVIFLPNNTASLMSTAIPRLRERGIEAYGFNFAPKVFQDRDNIYNLPTNFFFQIIFFFRFLYHLFTADVVHWIYGSSSKYALYILTAVGFLKKNKFIEFCGTDIRNLEHLCNDVPFYTFNDFSEEMKIDLGVEEASNATQLKFKSLGFRPIPNSPELYLYINPHIFNTYYPFSRSVDLSRFQSSLIVSKNEVPLVIHMPSNSEVKGSKYIMKAAEKLQNEGLIEFKLITNTPHQEALKILEKADIVIDQLIIGEYGVLSIEAMAMGKPVICFIRPELLNIYQTQFENFPIYNASIQNIEQKLRELVGNSEIRKELGDRGTSYVRRYHDAERNTDKLIQIYKKEIDPVRAVNTNSHFQLIASNSSIEQIRESILQFSKIASTNLFVQLITFLFYPFIARLFAPEEFGVFAFFASLNVIFSIIITGQFHNAVVNPDSDEDAKQLISIATWSSIICGSIFFFSLFAVSYFWKFEFEWFLFPFYLISYSLFEVWRMFFVRSKNYSTFNTSQIINRFGSNVFKVVKPISLGSVWLLLSEISCYFFACIYLLFKGDFFVVPFKKVRWSIAKEYFRFPVFQSSSLLIQLLISEFPAFYFKSIGDLDSLGFYSMGNRLFIQPCIILGNSLNPVLIHKFKSKLGLQTREIAKLFSAIGILALGVFAILFFFKDTFIYYFLGEKWTAGEPIYNVQIWLILSKLFLGTILAYIISRDKSHLLMVVRGIELVILLACLNLMNIPFLETYVALEILADFTLVSLVFWTNRARQP